MRIRERPRASPTGETASEGTSTDRASPTAARVRNRRRRLPRRRRSARARRRPRSRGWGRGRGRRSQTSRRTCLASGRVLREPSRTVSGRTLTSASARTPGATRLFAFARTRAGRRRRRRGGDGVLRRPTSSSRRPVSGPRARSTAAASTRASSPACCSTRGSGSTPTPCRRGRTRPPAVAGSADDDARSLGDARLAVAAAPPRGAPVNDDERFPSTRTRVHAARFETSRLYKKRRVSAESGGKGASARRARGSTSESPRSTPPFPPQDSRGERGAAAGGSRRARGAKKAAAPKRRLPRELSWLSRVGHAREACASRANGMRRDRVF